VAAGLRTVFSVQSSIEDHTFERKGRNTAPGMFNRATFAGATETPIPAATRLTIVTHCDASNEISGVKPAAVQTFRVLSKARRAIYGENRTNFSSFSSRSLLK
jgi:hypothetical protein